MRSRLRRAREVAVCCHLYRGWSSGPSPGLRAVPELSETTKQQGKSIRTFNPRAEIVWAFPNMRPYPPVNISRKNRGLYDAGPIKAPTKRPLTRPRPSATLSPGEREKLCAAGSAPGTNPALFPSERETSVERERGGKNYRPLPGERVSVSRRTGEGSCARPQLTEPSNCRRLPGRTGESQSVLDAHPQNTYKKMRRHAT